MSLRIRPGRVEGRLRAPPSKSHTHRAFILAALSGNGLVQNPLESDDTRATLEGLKSLGYLVTREKNGTRIGGHLRPTNAVVDAHESGSTLRLLLPLAATSPTPVTFHGNARLAQRPLEPLLQALRALGGTVERAPDGFPLRVRGPLRGGRVTLSASESSQFLSGLLLAAPKIELDLEVALTGPSVSRPYVDLTLWYLRRHGVTVHEDAGRFRMPGSQTVRQRPEEVPADWSSAAYLFAAAATTGGNVNLEGLDAGDPQGDARVLEHLEALGCCVMSTKEYVSVAGCGLKGADLDLKATPDLLPALAAVAACARGDSTFTGVAHARLKESDRIQAMVTNLRAFGVDAEARDDGLRIVGGRPQGATIQSFGDHRIAMASVAIALAARGDSTLADPDVVRKSYPGFFEDLGQIAPSVTA